MLWVVKNIDICLGFEWKKGRTGEFNSESKSILFTIFLYEVSGAKRKNKVRSLFYRIKFSIIIDKQLLLLLTIIIIKTRCESKLATNILIADSELCISS